MLAQYGPSKSACQDMHETLLSAILKHSVYYNEIINILIEFVLTPDKTQRKFKTKVQVVFRHCMELLSERETDK